MFMRSRNGSRGFRIGENSKPAPSVAGVHLSITAPCGTYTNPRRGEGFAAVLLSAVCAGSMESSNGRASVTPTPRRNVRRGRCFFVMNIILWPLLESGGIVRIYVTTGGLAWLGGGQWR